MILTVVVVGKNQSLVVSPWSLANRDSSSLRSSE